VDQRQDKHGVAGPVMEDLKLFMRHARQHRDEIRLRSQYPTSVNQLNPPAPCVQCTVLQHKRKKPQGHPPRSRRDRRTTSIGDCRRIRPVVWLRAKSHGYIVSGAPQPGQEAYQRRKQIPPARGGIRPETGTSTARTGSGSPDRRDSAGQPLSSARWHCALLAEAHAGRASVLWRRLRWSRT
jgi:hypothetical protein